MNSSSNNSHLSLGSPWNPCPSNPLGIQISFLVESTNVVVLTLNLALLECVCMVASLLRPLNYYLTKVTSLYKVNLFFYGLLISGRPLLQACVCLERYLGVVHPVLYLRYNMVRTRLRALPLVWALTFISSVCWVQKLIFAFPVLFLLVLILQGFCCVSILQVLHQPAPCGEEGHADPNRKKAFFTVLVLQILVVLNYLPTVLAMPLRGRLSRHAYSCLLLPASFAFSVFGGFIQPIMYLMGRGKLPCRVKG